MRTITGDLLAIDVRTGLEGDRIVAQVRLAEDVDPMPAAGRSRRRWRSTRRGTPSLPRSPMRRRLASMR